MRTVFLLAAVVVLGVYSRTVTAQNQPLGFFITSVGSGDGANLGGLSGADAHCQNLAKAVGAGTRTWRAYLSGVENAKPVNAKDRIGSGPWSNAKGVLVAQNVADLHGDPNKLTKDTQLTEKGAVVNGRGDTPNTHDILTGSNLDGTAFTDGADHTCNNWMSNSTGSAQVGHHDRQGGGANPTSWNNAHASKGCSQANLVATGGNGLFYCFAAK
ncbi:MAG TPA: hypothetical protein VNJ02_06650 [Vicinamibacterales bacterium]|nr:hypothetical protein [Vicinamibacterales bacterium]